MATALRTSAFTGLPGRLARVALALIAVCALLGAAAAAAGAQATTSDSATIAISVRTEPASDALFTFHVTGPACPGKSDTDITLQLHDGEAQVVPLCNSNPDRFQVTQASQDGWQLVDIQCDSTDPDPADRTQTDVAAGTASIELSPGEHKACEFVNAQVVPAPQPVATTAPPAPAPQPLAGAQPVSAPPPPAAGVAPTRVVSANAQLLSPRRCVSRRYTVSVVGGPVRSVAFSVNGKHVRTLRARRGQRRFAAVLGIRSTVDRVVARVSFGPNSAPRSRTLRATVRRCAVAQVRPQFTG